MKVTHLGRIAPAAAMAAFLGACVDAPAILDPSAAPVALGTITTAVAGEGELQICKVGNAAGTFSFSWEIVNRGDLSPVASGTVDVDVGQCVTAATVPTTTGGRYLATVTETALPALWAVTSITATNPGATPPTWPVPVIDLPGKSVSNIGMANDVGATVTFTNTYTPPSAPGCTYTQGYWKTHSEFGPAPYDATWAKLSNGASTAFFLSGQTYIEVFGTSPGGNAYYNLAHQYMAAELNGLSGADASAIQSDFDSATTLLQTYTPAQIGALKGSNALRQQFLALAGTLDAYNNGVTGPGHCN
jgi:hypothetical protein